MHVTDFTGFTDDTLDFLSGLKANNTREWFADNRPVHERSVKKPAQAFSQLMAAELEKLTGAPQNPKIFRINRDVRFSNDKSPYNTHIHMSWTPGSGGEGAPAFMFGLSTDYCTTGCGVFEFPGPMLDRWRATLAGPGGDEVAGLVEKLAKAGCRIDGPALKRPPAGFAADHPLAELSRHKGFAAWCDFETPRAATEPDIARHSLARFERLLPLWRFLSGLNQN